MCVRACACACVRAYVCVCVCVRCARVAWMFHISKSKTVIGKELYWSAAKQSAIKSSHNAKFFNKAQLLVPVDK